MALIWMDGCTHYTTNYMTQKWGLASAAQVASVYDVGKRRPGSGHVKLVLEDAYVQTPVLSLTNRAVIGVALYVAAESGGIIFYSGTTPQMSLAWDGSRRLHVKRGDDETGTILASSDINVVPVGSWFYLEFDGTVDDSSGASEVRLNGSAIGALTLSGVDTKPSAVTGVDRIRIIRRGAYNDLHLTDLYVDSNTFQGDCIVETIMPTANGAHADFTPSAGTNYENVDGSIDDDETYNASNTQDHMDTFAFGDLTSMASSEILGLAVNLSLRKDDSATRQVKPVARIGSTDYLHGTAISPAGTYAVAQRIWETNPADAAAWEEADVNGAEFGYKQTLVS